MSDTNTILQNSQNIKSIPDFVNHNPSGDNNVFVCLVGENNSYLTDISNMDNKLRGTFAYNRISSLPTLPPDKVGFYENKYNEWLRNFKRKAPTAATVYNEKLSEQLAAALTQTLDLFRKSRKNTTDSIEKNFAMNLLFRYDFALADTVSDSRSSNGIKIVGENVSKIQEYLFYCMLALTGADVLLLQNKKDLDIPSKNLNVFAVTVLGHLGNTNIPPFTKIHTQTLKPDYRNNYTPPTPQNHHPTVKIPPRSRKQPVPSVQPQPRQNSNPAVTIPPRQNRQNTPVQPPVPRPSLPTRPPQAPQPVRSTPYVQPTIPQRQEKSYEDLAVLASSVVQIFGIQHKPGDPDKFRILGSGSGIMISRNGYILTNFHVAKQSNEYAIRIENDERVYFTNSIVKYHPDFDLAILKIDRVLTPLPIYNGTKPLVRGQKVVAIGSPEGLFNTVSDGIISAFRTIDGVNMIQFTAPISSGSSGGAVLNMYGEVIGISTSGIDDGQNINFAVGYDIIRNFARGIIQ